jgi:hypothetical protein
MRGGRPAKRYALSLLSYVPFWAKDILCVPASYTDAQEIPWMIMKSPLMRVGSDDMMNLYPKEWCFN